MGEIFLAKRIGVAGFEKTFAVKRMLDSLAASPEFVAMFFDEARMAAQLCHPNIAQIYDFGVVDGHYYLAMEHIPGEDLNTIIKQLRDEQRDAPVGMALRIGIDVCAGLGYAHTFSEEGRPLGIIHRDVSPANIMVSYQGAVKLLDFGIAKATSQVGPTRTGRLKGKSSFIAPEQLRGLPADGRANLFSLGIGLYGLLTRRHPFRRASEAATMQAIVESEVPDPRRYRPDLSAPVAGIVLRALARDREKRFSSAAEMAAAMQSVLATEAPGTGQAELGVWLAGLFGRSRMERRSRVPTSTQLSLTRTSTPMPGRTGSTASAPAVAPLAPAATRPWWVTTLGMTLAALLGATVIFGAGRSRPAGPVDVARPAVTRAPAVPALPPSAMIPAPPAPERPAASPATGRRLSPAAARLRPDPLDLATLQATVRRSQHRFVTCFGRHAVDLPGDTGQVRMELAVVSSGRVSRAQVVRPAIAATALAACLEAEARRVRFPRHAEQEIRFAVPLSYRRGQ